MPVATVTSKGQVTIPKHVREHLDVHSGDKLEFRIGDDGTVFLVPITRSAESVFGAFAHKAERPVSRGEAKEKVSEALRRKSSVR
jgi:AbrB family looped-hinge helix DNA binding protein